MAGEKQRLEVKIRQHGLESRQRLWNMEELMAFLDHLMHQEGLFLTIHASNGTKVEVYPKCLRCRCYNTIKPLVDGLCEHCLELKDGR